MSMLTLATPVIGLVLMLGLQKLEDWLVRTQARDARVATAHPGAARRPGR
jgi:hypothetical protein